MLFNYDIRTLAFLTGWGSFVFAAWLLYFGWKRPARNAFNYWVSAALLSGVGMTLLSFRGVLPDFFTIIVSNVCIASYFVYLYGGIERIKNIRTRFVPVSMIGIALMTLLFLYFTYASPNVSARIVTLSSFLTLISAYSLACLFRRFRLRNRGNALPGIIVYVVIASWSCFRMLYTLFFESALQDFMSSGVVQQLSFFVFCGVSIIVMLWVMLLTSERLRESLDSSNKRLKMALDEVKTLRGIVPICSCCKKIRNDEGYYESLEAYLTKYTDASFSHSVCPECVETLYPEQAVRMDSQKRAAS